MIILLKRLDDMRKVHPPCLLKGKLRMQVSSADDHVEAYMAGTMLTWDDICIYCSKCRVSADSLDQFT